MTRKPWWYRLLTWADGYWHVYVCNLVEKHADEKYEADEG